MARRPLPRILTGGTAPLARGREIARTAADSATDVIHPLLTIGRGLRLLAAAGRGRWAETPKDKRGPTLFLVAACLLVIGLIPYGPALALAVLAAAAAWQGRDRTPARTGPGEAESERLASLYEALVPYFSLAEDPSPLFAHGGDWERAFSEYAFDDAGRLTRLRIRYPAYFTDGEPAARARIEQLLHAKSGRGREYLFGWDEEGNRLDMGVLAPLPVGIAAQRWVTAPGETVLGFTDPDEVRRTLPVTDGEEVRDLPPVIWRTGVRATEPHLLAVGEPGSGTSSLLRSVALQALRHGDVLIVEGGGHGEYACLTGRTGVLAVEGGLTGALATLEWAAHETERRLIAAGRARQSGLPAPEDTRRPLWILLDRPGVLRHLAAAEGRPDPLSLLQVALRHGRAANVTVVVAEQFDALELLGEAVFACTRARVVLGPVSPDRVAAVLGAAPHSTPATEVPPGRGYARLGAGPVLRLQVPATPDPYDDTAAPAARQAVLDLLPERRGQVEPAAAEPVPAQAAPQRAASDEPDAPAGPADGREADPVETTAALPVAAPKALEHAGAAPAPAAEGEAPAATGGSPGVEAGGPR
ncbi:hypothetical protein [Streptomyces sp. NPDC097619]|uniref:hypothetical protein n=1 Tax=Streptomyces sp. NPDC097619 TaxID=3157228 RepID=UPI003326160B